MHCLYNERRLIPWPAYIWWYFETFYKLCASVFAHLSSFRHLFPGLGKGRRAVPEEEKTFSSIKTHHVFYRLSCCLWDQKCLITLSQGSPNCGRGAECGPLRACIPLIPTVWQYTSDTNVVKKNIFSTPTDQQAYGIAYSHWLQYGPPKV